MKEAGTQITTLVDSNGHLELENQVLSDTLEETSQKLKTAEKFIHRTAEKRTLPDDNMHTPATRKRKLSVGENQPNYGAGRPRTGD